MCIYLILCNAYLPICTWYNMCMLVYMYVFLYLCMPVLSYVCTCERIYSSTMYRAIPFFCICVYLFNFTYRYSHTCIYLLPRVSIFVCLYSCIILCIYLPIITLAFACLNSQCMLLFLSLATFLFVCMYTCMCYQSCRYTDKVTAWCVPFTGSKLSAPLDTACER